MPQTTKGGASNQWEPEAVNAPETSPEEPEAPEVPAEPVSEPSGRAAARKRAPGKKAT